MKKIPFGDPSEGGVPSVHLAAMLPITEEAVWEAFPVADGEVWLVAEICTVEPWPIIIPAGDETKEVDIRDPEPFLGPCNGGRRQV